MDQWVGLQCFVQFTQLSFAGGADRDRHGAIGAGLARTHLDVLVSDLRRVPAYEFDHVLPERVAIFADDLHRIVAREFDSRRTFSRRLGQLKSSLKNR